MSYNLIIVYDDVGIEEAGAVVEIPALNAVIVHAFVVAEIVAVRNSVIFDPNMAAIMINAIGCIVIDYIAADEDIFSVVAGLIATGFDAAPDI